ncbi:MAG: ABC transporter permease, partial [Cyanobacteria bacterium P01_H01_bin.121]
SVTGTTPSYLQVRNVDVEQGRFLSPVDLQNQSRVAILGYETAQTLFGTQNPIGDRIRIKSISFEVVGVMQERGASFGQNLDTAVYIPVPVMVDQLTGRKSTQSSPSVNLIAISTEDLEQASEAEFQITNLLRLRHNISDPDDDDFGVRAQQELLEAANNVTDVLTLVLGATAGISLLVGGVGITNIMLVSVTERTREIGLRKAIGATRSDILLQFAIEAMILSTIGGLVGIVIGVGGIVGVAAFTPLEAVLSPAAVVLAVTVSGSIGLVFGVIPARNAARLDPIVALRA